MRISRRSYGRGAPPAFHVVPSCSGVLPLTRLSATSRLSTPPLEAGASSVRAGTMTRVRLHRPIRLRPVLLAAVLCALVPLAFGCTEADPEADRPHEGLGGGLEAPPRSAYAGGDTAPGPEDGRVDLTVADGRRVVLWLEPPRHRRVREQHTTAGGAWSQPRTLFRSGAGCLFLRADAAEDLVAVTAGCYAEDAFGQQAPDEGQALVTTDLETWQRHEPPRELYGAPRVAASGALVTWAEDPLRWTPQDGFTDPGQG